MNIIRLYIGFMRKCGNTTIRRWWVKSYIRVEVREIFGAYETLFTSPKMIMTNFIKWSECHRVILKTFIIL